MTADWMTNERQQRNFDGGRRKSRRESAAGSFPQQSGRKQAAEPRSAGGSLLLVGQPKSQWRAAGGGWATEKQQQPTNSPKSSKKATADWSFLKFHFCPFHSFSHNPSRKSQSQNGHNKTFFSLPSPSYDFGSFPSMTLTCKKKKQQNKIGNLHIVRKLFRTQKTSVSVTNIKIKLTRNSGAHYHSSHQLTSTLLICLRAKTKLFLWWHSKPVVFRSRNYYPPPRHTPYTYTNIYV
jgi:hypothetical protein